MCDKNRELPIGRLMPRTKFRVSPKRRQRIKASLQAVGLIEPLIVGDGHEILDGNLRYEILQEMGVKTIPCFFGQTPPTNQEQTYD